jgi:hypothetical protein
MTSTFEQSRKCQLSILFQGLCLTASSNAFRNVKAWDGIRFSVSSNQCQGLCFNCKLALRKVNACDRIYAYQMVCLRPYI